MGLEPISLLAGFLVPLWDLPRFVALQLPSRGRTLKAISTSQYERMLALQLSNMFGLVSMIAVGVLYGTSEISVVRKYLIACALGDVGHLWAVYAGMGHEDFFNISNWNEYAWGSIGFTALLLVCRLLYLAGFFGPDVGTGGDEKLLKPNKRRD